MTIKTGMMSSIDASSALWGIYNIFDGNSHKNGSSIEYIPFGNTLSSRGGYA